MLLVPLQAIPNQAVLIGLDSQVCQINVYQKEQGLFMDLYSDGALIAAGIICENLNPIVRYKYLGFNGDFAFIDNQGNDDPDYTGLGPTTSARFVLAYLSPSDLVGTPEA